MRTRSYSLGLLVVAVAVAAWIGCSAGEGGRFGSSSSSGQASSGTAGSGATASGSSSGGGEGGCFLCSTGGSGAAPSGVLVISPENPELAVVDGNIPTQQFKALLNGQDVTSKVTWVFGSPAVGDIKTDAIFVPTGKVAGLGTDQALFDNPAGADPQLSLVYPYPETVLPLRVLAPQLQWNGGSPGDVYRLHMKSKLYDYVEYFAAPASPSKYEMPQSQWEDIEFSGQGPISDPLAVELARKSGPTAYQPKGLVLHIAQGFVYGSVYYWELPDACGGGGSNGRILRIKPSSPTTDEFYKTNQCWGCHTVSRDGKQLFASFSIGSPFPFQSIDLTQDPAVLGPIVQATGIAGTFAAYNHDGSKIMYSDNGGSKSAPQSYLHIISSANGQAILQNAMGPGCGEGAWSPDGNKLAAICGMKSGYWTFDAGEGDLVVADYDNNANQKKSDVTIVPKGGGQGRPAYPSFSPDTKFIAYGRPTSGSRTTGNGTLWLVSIDGANTAELIQAEQGDGKSFNPVFAPKSAGGYYWLVFISRRSYGNQLVNKNRQQLWITAIDDPPVAGDSSHPPFYVRGQLDCGKNENAYYALDPCKELGAPCTTGIECCNGQCVYDKNLDQYVCGEPPKPGECVLTGNACTEDAECCDYSEVLCIQGFCQKPAPK
ncbi:MAG: hypothetical protein HY744_02205 [Deltaproteobacteria bacterium]|nr:hypothetical protein [Deltaproteobacteria bacterium]